MTTFQTAQYVQIASEFYTGTAPRLLLDTRSNQILIDLHMSAGDDIRQFCLSNGGLDYLQNSEESGDKIAFSLAQKQATVRSAAVESLFDTHTELSRSAAFYTDDTGFVGDRFTLLATTSTGREILVAAGLGQPGLVTLARNSDELLSPLSSQGDTSRTYLGDVQMMASAVVAEQQLIFAASEWEAGVSAYRLDSSGRLTHLDSLGTHDGVGLNAPTALLATQISSQPVLLLAAAGSSSISVIGVDGNGQLSLLDHEVDTLSSRFGAVTVMESIIHGGQTYVVAGGGDDGLTLFALLDSGQLLVLDSLADSTTLGLNNVNGLALQMQGDTLHVFATSETEAGLSHTTATLAADAVQMGSSGNDTLSAGNTGAVLLDGHGNDQLIGGLGQDVFVLVADGDTDMIQAFDSTKDRIDLSAWDALSSVAQLNISSRADGALIRYGSESLRLFTSNGNSLDMEDFLRQDLLGLYRPQPETDAAVILTSSGELIGASGEDRLIGRDNADVLYGQAGDDHLLGNGGRDTLWGGLGHDSLQGGDDSDVLYGEDGNDVMDGNAGHDLIFGGFGDDSQVGGTGADTLVGGYGNDTLHGDTSTDIIYGDEGNDSITGGTGDDTIYGGDGNDRLFGNTSLDTIYGGAGDDYISSGDGVDYVEGGEGNDTIYGRSGWDTLLGGEGDDSMVGSEGDDQLSGGTGDDWLSGGSAWDALYGNSGNDTLYGNFGSDVLSGGLGEDELYGGTGEDTLRGGADDDVLLGNQGVDRLEGGSGNDLLRGGTLVDTFVFDVGHDADEVEDFAIGEDVLRLSSDLVGGQDSGQAVLTTYADVTAEGVLLDFGRGDRILFSNLQNYNGLAADIEFF